MRGQNRLGEILLRKGLLTDIQVQNVLDRQRRYGGRFASHCLQLGYLEEREILQHLCGQVGYPGVVFNSSIIDSALARMLPSTVAMREQVLPIGAEDQRIIVAVRDPSNIGIIDEIQFVTGRKVSTLLAMEVPLQQAIRGCYDRAERGQGLYVGHGATVDRSSPHLELVSPTPDAPTPDIEEVEPVAAEVVVPSSELEVVTGVVVEDDLSGATQTVGTGGSRVEESEVGPLPSEDRPMMRSEESVPRPTETGPQISPLSERATDSLPPDAPTVLLVDDEPSILDLYRTCLEGQGYRLLVAANGTEALRRIAQDQPDLIVLDAMLPDIHGFEICRKIKQSKGYKHIPVIIVSAVYKGWRFEQDVKQNYGANAFLEKPFNVDRFCELIQSLLTGMQPGVDQAKMTDEALAEVNQGIELLKNEQPDEALACFKRAWEAAPFSGKLHYLIGNAYRARGEVYRALAEYEKAVEMEPLFFAGLKDLAVLYEKNGFKKKARELWERALDAAPSDDLREKIRTHLIDLL